MNVLRLDHNEYIVHIKNETINSYSDIALSAAYRSYHLRYFLGEMRDVSTVHSVHCGEPTLNSCLLLASDGQTTVHANSGLLHNDRCLVAVSSSLVCLQLPDLNIVWQTKVDAATCFGIYHLPHYDSYLSHGELTIARIAYDGDIVWACGGKDIFTDGVNIYEDYIDAVDFNNEKYRIDLLTGYSRISPF